MVRKVLRSKDKWITDMVILRKLTQLNGMVSNSPPAVMTIQLVCLISRNGEILIFI